MLKKNAAWSEERSRQHAEHGLWPNISVSVLWPSQFPCKITVRKKNNIRAWLLQNRQYHLYQTRDVKFLLVKYEYFVCNSTKKTETTHVLEMVFGISIHLTNFFFILLFYFRVCLTNKKREQGLHLSIQTVAPPRSHDVLPAGTAETINLIEHFIIDLVNYSLMHLNFFHNIFINGRDSCRETLTLITIKGARKELRITSSQIMRGPLFSWTLLYWNYVTRQEYGRTSFFRGQQRAFLLLTWNTREY